MTFDIISAENRPIIIGGGATGLSAAYQLAKMNLNPIVLEASEELGGLAGDFDLGSGKLEKFYHHWFSSDQEVFDLVRELGLGDSILRRETATGMYYANQVFKLSSPTDLLKYTPLPMRDRLRLGIMALAARRVRDWRRIEHLTAEEWLVSLGGQRVYDQVWAPLLNGKFGDFAGDVGASWMWTKLHLRGGSRGRNQKEELYYLKNGSGQFMSALAKSATDLGAEIYTGQRVTGIRVDDNQVKGVQVGELLIPTNNVITTIAPPLVAQLLASQRHEAIVNKQVRELENINYLANVCVTLLLTESLSDTYWLNVADPDFPYVGVIEHTNMFEDEKWGSTKIVYLSRYLPKNDPMYEMSDDDLVEYSIPHLKKMFPKFEVATIKGSHVWRAEFAQPIITPNYSSIKPSLISEISGLYMSSMAHVFPEDRGVNYALRYGREVGHVAGETILDVTKDERTQYAR